MADMQTIMNSIRELSQNMESRFASGDQEMQAGILNMQQSMQQGLKSTEDDIKTALGRVDGTMNTMKEGMKTLNDRIEQVHTTNFY